MFFVNCLLIYSTMSLLMRSLAQAEVIDKCPLFVSRMLEAKGFVLLSGSEALFRLFIFSGIYLLIWSCVYLIWWKFRWAWLKLIPLIGLILILLTIGTEISDGENPCNLFSLFQELSFPLNVIEGCFYFVLILCPLTLFFIFKKRTIHK